MRTEAETFLKIVNAIEKTDETLSFVQFRAIYEALGLTDEDGHEVAEAMKQEEGIM